MARGLKKGRGASEGDKGIGEGQKYIKHSREKEGMKKKGAGS